MLKLNTVERTYKVLAQRREDKRREEELFADSMNRKIGRCHYCLIRREECRDQRRQHLAG